MTRPDFSIEELYLISVVKDQENTGKANAYMWGYLIGGVAFALLAAWNENTPMVVMSVFLVCGFRLAEARTQDRWAPIWRSIISKYEAAFDDAPIHELPRSPATDSAP